MTLGEYRLFLAIIQECLSFGINNNNKIITIHM